MGKDGSTWRHDYIPTNLAAAILKAHGSKSGARQALRKPLRRMSDRQLEHHFSRPDVGDSGHAVKATIGEMQRRETAARRKASATAIRHAAQSAHRDHLEGQFTAAENETRGYLVNKRGRAAGVDGRTLFTANAATRNAYASDELREYIGKNPVLSAGAFRAAQRQQKPEAPRKAAPKPTAKPKPKTKTTVKPVAKSVAKPTAKSVAKKPTSRPTPSRPTPKITPKAKVNAKR